MFSLYSQQKKWKKPHDIAACNRKWQVHNVTRHTSQRPGVIASDQIRLICLVINWWFTNFQAFLLSFPKYFSTSYFVDNWGNLIDLGKVSSWMSGRPFSPLLWNIFFQCWPLVPLRLISHHVHLSDDRQRQLAEISRGISCWTGDSWRVWFAILVAVNSGGKIIIRVHSQEVYVLLFTAGLPVVYQSAGTLWNRWSGLSGGIKEKLFKTQHVMVVDEQHILSVSGVGLLYFFQTSRCKLAVPSESPPTWLWPSVFARVLHNSESALGAKPVENWTTRKGFPPTCSTEDG